MKVLFLDVDGVLNTRVGSLDGDKLDLIRDIVKATGCKIVLSSTWRKNEQQLMRIMRELPIHSRTPVLENQDGSLWTGQPRGHEIDAWLKSSPVVENFVILDDQTDMDPWIHRLVKTEFHTGLTRSLAELAIRRLKAE